MVILSQKPIYYGRARYAADASLSSTGPLAVAVYIAHFITYIEVCIWPGMRQTPPSPQRVPWPLLFLVKLLAIGQLEEGKHIRKLISNLCSRYGNSSISWQRILGPSIKMAKEGIPVSKTLAGAVADKNWFAQKTWHLTKKPSQKPKVGPNPEGDIHGPIHWSRLGWKFKAQTTSAGSNTGGSCTGMESTLFSLDPVA